MLLTDKIKERLEQDHVFSVATGMFKQDIMFCYGADKDKLEAEVLEACKPEHHKKVKKIWKGFKKDKFAGVYHAKQPVRIIYVTPQSTLSEFMQIMSHEVQHATVEILDYVGIPLGDDSEESYAYLLGDIIENIVYNMFEYEEPDEVKADKELLEDLSKGIPSEPNNFLDVLSEILTDNK